MKKNNFILILSLLSLSVSFSQEKFSLKQAIDYAVKNTYAIKNANLDIDAAKHKKWETTTIGLPQINAEVAYQNFIKQPISLIPAEFFGGAPGEFSEFSFGTKQNLNASATLSQLLFNGSYLAGLQSAKVYLKISELAKVKTEKAIKETVISAYGNVILAKESIQIIENNLSLLDKTIQDTNEIYNNGFAEEQDVEQLQITRSSLNNQLNKSKGLLIVAKNMLKITMGIEVDQSIALTDKLENLSNTQIDLAISNEELNLDNHIDYQIMKNSVRAQELVVKLEKSKYLPQLTAFLNYGTTANSQTFTFTDSKQRWFDSSLFGISLDVPIFSSFKRNSRVQQAKIALTQTKTTLTETEQKLKLQVENAKVNYQFALDNFNTTNQNLALAKRIEKKEQVKFFEGVGSSFNLTQAQNQLYSTQQQYLSAIIQIINTKAKLETALND